ncbi:MAG: GspE/PulE family protein [Patescibacteria group bacterium]
MKLLQELFANAIINEERKNELEGEIKKTGKTEEELILEKKLYPEDSLFGLKSKIYKIPLKKVKADQVPLEILELIPEEAATNYKIAPLERRGNVVEIGMAYPEDAGAQNALRFLARQQNFTYEIFLISLTDLNSLLKQHRTLKSETNKALEEFGKEKSDSVNFRDGTPVKIMAEDAPIIKMVLVILRHAVEGNASDIHIEPGREKLNVRFRLDGILHPSLFLPLNVHPSIVARIKILAGLKIDENRLPQDGRFSANINNQDIDFRVATFPALFGEKVEIRVLDSKEGLKSFEQLGLRGRNFEIVADAIKKPYGLILSTGPTGSGKTTTQYALLRTLNKDSVNIVTIEDPIEYSIFGVNQSQVKPEIGYTFANGLRQILRQDPNIIMVGEVRDEETADLVMHAALTGHIVLSTLHTNSSVGVIPRLIDMGIRPFLIPSALRLAISQRLVRTLCEKCKIKTKPSEKARSYISEKIIATLNYKNLPPSFYVYQAKGCEACNFKGYSGRTGIFEVFSMTRELADLIMKSPLESLILKQAQKQGMLTMEQEGILKVLNGETSLEEIAGAVEGI